MKTKFTFLIILFSIFNLFAQKYESGYYIDNSGNKFEGFIKNVDWKNNPKSFEFKKNIDDNNLTITIEMCKEFSIDNVSKFTRSKVQIEKSTLVLQNIDFEKELIFVEETIFLKHLITGKNTLYYFYEGGLEKFFYSKDDQTIKQLIYVKFLAKDGISISENEKYKRQLWEDVKCESTKFSDLNSLRFNGTELKKYFTKINTCNGSLENVAFQTKKSIFSIKGVLSANSDNLNFDGQIVKGSYEKKVNIGAGFEMELLMPFNNYSWGIFIEPTYSKYSNKKTFVNKFNGPNLLETKVDMSIFQVPVGIRHYFKTSESSNVIIGAGMNLTNFSGATKIDFKTTSDYYMSNFTTTFFGSVGFNFNKASFEFRFNTNNNAAESQGYEISFNRTSLVLKYELFRK